MHYITVLWKKATKLLVLNFWHWVYVKYQILMYWGIWSRLFIKDMLGNIQIIYV